MWYDGLGVISIGAECGGPQDGGLGTIKVDLWHAFMRRCSSTHCPAVDHYALALRIDGEFQTFGPEGIERPRRSKKTRCIGTDIVISESTWKNKSGNELRDYLATTIRASLAVCVSRLRKDKELIDEKSLFNEVDSAIEDFQGFDYLTRFPSPVYCPSCGQLLTTGLANQCLKCGTDWHHKETE
jgi:hypothetical protein